MLRPEVDKKGGHYPPPEGADLDSHIYHHLGSGAGLIPADQSLEIGPAFLYHANIISTVQFLNTTFILSSVDNVHDFVCRPRTICTLFDGQNNDNRQCLGLTMLNRFSIIKNMNKLDSQTRAQVISCLIEGCSIRATVRMTGIAKKTVMRLLFEVGSICAEYQDKVFRNLRCKKLQLDEMWSWIYCKEKNRTEEIAKKNPAAGDIWLWTAIDADTKLVPAWMLGSRDGRTARRFVSDLASRLSHRVQITTDSHRPYLQAVEDAFGGDVDYAMLHKIYGFPMEHETRYSPATCIGCEQKRISGNPDIEHVSTSFIERQNWTVRTNMRRYTRLSNGFSRKIENHAAAVALNYFAYNFIKIHRTLRVTPAMAAGVTDRLWEVKDLVSLWEQYEAKAA